MGPPSAVRINESMDAAPDTSARAEPASSRGVVPVLAALLLIGCALNLLITARRFQSLLRDGPYVVTSGIESPALYGIWKRLHGHPVYEFPDGQTYPAQLFNFNFYETYAGLLRLAGVDGFHLPVGARLITALFGLAGVAVSVAMVRRAFAPVLRPGEMMLVVVAVSLAWFGTYFTSWWVLTARPDIAAAAFATAGLVVTLIAIQRHSLVTLLVSSLLFFLAWSFKQTGILTYTGTLLFTLVCVRSMRALAMLILPFALLAGVTIALGSPAYRHLCYEAPRLASADVPAAISLLRRALMAAWPLLAPALLGALWQLRIAWRERRLSRWGGAASPASLTATALAIVVLVALLGGVAGMCKAGASRNYLLECVVASGALWALMLVRFLRRLKLAGGEAPLPAMVGWTLSLLGIVLIPSLQLLAPNHYGVQDKLDAKALAQRVRLAELCRTLPRPTLSLIEPLNLPWFSSDNQYPAYVVDYYVYEPMMRSNRLGRSIDDQIRHGPLKSLILTGSPESRHYGILARAHGWRDVEIAAGELEPGVSLLVAP